MDATWFKQQQRRLGITSFDLGKAIDRDRSVISKIINGYQKMTLDQARALAQALDVPFHEMVARAGLADPATAQQLAPGFSESDAAPWQGQGAEGDRTRRIAEIYGARPGVDVWQVKGRGMAFGGYLPGDFILVDTHAAERARRGDDVIAQVYRGSGARTVFRRYEPPVLVPLSPDPEDLVVIVVDGDSVVIRGKVVASWRG
jgi:SOS-response transcriptional repressor LexA